jgi:hypothetical protein
MDPPRRAMPRFPRRGEVVVYYLLRGASIAKAMLREFSAAEGWLK